MNKGFITSIIRSQPLLCVPGLHVLESTETWERSSRPVFPRRTVHDYQTFTLYSLKCLFHTVAFTWLLSSQTPPAHGRPADLLLELVLLELVLLELVLTMWSWWHKRKKCFMFYENENVNTIKCWRINISQRCHAAAPEAGMHACSKREVWLATRVCLFLNLRKWFSCLCFVFFSAGSRKHHRKGELTFPSIIVLPSMKKSDLPGSKNHSICEKVIKMNF